ncbi:response regulator [Rhodospirillaceae bacterium KN72]|uniref:Response regulator n=1 Tax=Pacificispira spongiicola TaxID=2729598 RepID=A0A7Y0E3E2_9PROT|nr:response regulator transcription factor [Pacificispira spongiicola]NMM46504.1 response regulator [Pacificispira spongiicola]
MQRILIVEDDPRMLELLTSILEAEGYAVDVTDNGQAGIERAMSNPLPDALILDLNMRDVLGWDVIRSIRGASVGSDVPILVLSAFGSAQDRDEAFDAGCTAYESKPVDRDRLIDRVKAVLKSRSR